MKFFDNYIVGVIPCDALEIVGAFRSFPAHRVMQAVGGIYDVGRMLA